MRRPWTHRPWTVVVLAAATYRITRLLTTDQLPPVADARVWLEDHLPANWAHGPACPWCVGFWVAAAVTAAAELAETSGHRRGLTLAAMPWALSAVVGMLADRELG